MSSNYYRKGSRDRLLSDISRVMQSETAVEELRAALVAEGSVKRPRRWLIRALQQRIDDLSKRITKLSEISVTKLLPYLTAEHGLEYAGCATQWMRLPDDRQQPAVRVSLEEAQAFFSRFHPSQRLLIYSFGGCLLYFGELQPSNDGNSC